METVSLDDLTAVNEQLAALADVGVPLDLPLGPPGRSTSQALEQISATVRRRVVRGETLEQALEGDEQEIPATYRSLLRISIHGGNLSTTLDGSRRVAESIDESRFTLGTAFVYPLVLCALAYVGLIGFCLFLVPVWQDMYEQIGRAPGLALRTLQALRETLPYWAAVPPILLLWALISWRRNSRSRGGSSQRGDRRAWLPGTKRMLCQERCANYATTLGALLNTGMPLDEALVIAGDASNDANLRAGSQLLAADVKYGGLPSDNSQTALLFPPFLRWTLWHAEETTGRGQALDIAARMYRSAAERRAERLRIWAPVAAILVVGATVTLLYTLALFLPFVELIRALAS